jgi:hypothetical protein
LPDHATGIARHLQPMRSHPRVSFPSGFKAHRVAPRERHDDSGRLVKRSRKNRGNELLACKLLTLL